MFLYEEFMARSSTRMALQKGANYMGMMNVLMQLRKVCNHPDLFEPRSIITPFLLETIGISTADCISSATSTQSSFDTVSPHLLYPVWSIGSGLPSSHHSMKHDRLISTRLKQLRPSHRDFLSGISFEKAENISDLKPGLKEFLKSIHNDEITDKKINASNQMRINEIRCDDQYSIFSSGTIDKLIIDPKIPSDNEISEMHKYKIAETPTELLAMKKSQEERKDEMSGILDKFRFYVPKAAARSPTMYSRNTNTMNASTLKTLQAEFNNVGISMSNSNEPFFPDKKLVQFDAGKLQILAELLHSLKQEKHRVLIFTQMSKMLDILEVFLNLNGHTYLRLDGSTGVEQRQKLMDRFNNDEKVFCFILSTRSGGLGINLTGADTVVFYDSDWNPAMDAQAQDRAHRIGQTRDVHIYRLVSQHTIEENILVKAKQKRQLDFLVMDEGKFYAAKKGNSEQSKKDINEEGSENCDVATKSGLRSILGLVPEVSKSTVSGEKTESEDMFEPKMSKEEMESTMAKLEDEDDVLAMRGAQKEAQDELQEFDESIKIEENQTEGGIKVKDENPNQGITNDAQTEEEKLEKEFTAWQRQVGADKESIDAALNPVERYALRFREDVDPFYSMWYITEQKRKEQVEMLEDEIDIEEIEAMKAEDEYYAIEEGDLLATTPSIHDLYLHRCLYHQEKSRIKANKKRRKLTGENWKTEIDGKTQFPFWYNTDTGEAVWDKPKVLMELEEDEIAQQLHWNALPIKPLIAIMSYLIPHPERMKCASVCRQWRVAAQDISFIRHVYPVEMGALTMNPEKIDKYHYRSIPEALLEALPGDTIGKFFTILLSKTVFKISCS